MAASPPYHLLVSVIIIFAAANKCDAKKNATGFSSYLIHRDHPKSPLYNPNLTRWERVEASVRRSLPRMNSLASAIRRRTLTPNEMLSNMTSLNDGEYFMEFYIGGPGVKTLWLIDTGSQFTWLHCKPCLNEPKQCGDLSTPLFDPSRSISYVVQDCSKSPCNDGSPMFSCNQLDNTCKYALEYADGTISRGAVAEEGIAFYDNEMGQVVFRIIMGCGHEDVFTTSIRPQGLVGLSKGSLSLAKQIELRSFSHCFDEATDVSSTVLRNVMRFGTNSILDGGKTPMLEGRFMEDLYFLHLEGISVGNRRVTLPDQGYTFNISGSGTKGFIIDSGTTLTYLEEKAYYAVVNEMRAAVFYPACDAAFEGKLNPCYCKITKEDLESLAPDLTFHFGGGLNLTIGKATTWIQFEGKICLGLLNSGPNAMSVFGNYNQRNMNVGYDLTRKEISFQPLKDCSSTHA